MSKTDGLHFLKLPKCHTFWKSPLFKSQNTYSAETNEWTFLFIFWETITKFYVHFYNVLCAVFEMCPRVKDQFVIKINIMQENCVMKFNFEKSGTRFIKHLISNLGYVTKIGGHAQTKESKSCRN